SLRMRGAALKRIAGAWRLGRLIGGIYALLALLLADGLKDQDTGLQASLSGRSAWQLIGDAITPWSLSLVIVLFFGLKSFADVDNLPGKGLPKGLKRWLFGVLHWAGHVVPAVALTVVSLWLLEGW